MFTDQTESWLILLKELSRLRVMFQSLPHLQWEENMVMIMTMVTSCYIIEYVITIPQRECHDVTRHSLIRIFISGKKLTSSERVDITFTDETESWLILLMELSRLRVMFQSLPHLQWEENMVMIMMMVTSCYIIKYVIAISQRECHYIMNLIWI